MEAIELRNEVLSMRLLPECGGKIESLRSVMTGREWLWSNPYLPLRHPVYGESYVENLDTGGWDEIFPSVKPCRLSLESGETLAIPDHGELVSLPWKVEERAVGLARLSCEGRAWPYRFERRIELTEEGFTARYELENRHPRLALPWLWCAHPLMALEPGMTVSWRAPDGVAMDSFRIPDCAAAGFQPSAKKRFVTGAASVSLASPDGREAFTLAYDAEDIPALAFWANFLGWTGARTPPLFNLGIEPASGPWDALDAALAAGAGAHRLLRGGETCSWKLNLWIR